MKKRACLLLCAFIGCLASYAQPLTIEQYRHVQGLNQAALKTALHDLIQPHQVPAYGGKGEGYTWAGFAVTDVMPDGSVRDRYSNIRREFDGLKAVTGMNIEHIWANSWWGHTVNNAYCDLFNLYPADGSANGRKSNNPIGIVDGTVAFDNDVTKVGKSSSYRADSLITAWEPADEWKGDFARTYFYMATTYQHMTDEWTTTEGLLTVDPEAWTTMRPWVYELMLSWAAADPVDDIERTRNEAICGIQGNRNPYVDYPELADYVWGAHSDEVFYIEPSSTTPEVFVPVQDATIDFGLQALSLGLNRSIMVRGRNLPTGLTATIEGDGFKMADADLTAQEITAGTPLTIHSTATAGGVYEATLILRSEDLYEQRTSLRMTMIDGVPAYPARDITCTKYSRSFTASWMDMHLLEGESYTLDVFTKTEGGERKSFTGFPMELTDTFCVVKNPAASVTYYYEITTTGGLISNEVEVEMPTIAPIFSASSYGLSFTTVPNRPSREERMVLTLFAVPENVTQVTLDLPFEVSVDGEEWQQSLILTGTEPTFYVRMGAVSEAGEYESEMILTTRGLEEKVVTLTASVDVQKSFFEGFEVGTKTASGYAEGTVTCNAATWRMVEAYPVADEHRNGSRSVRLRNKGFMEMLEDKSDGCDSLWFYAGSYGTDTGVKLSAYYSLDAGANWTVVAENIVMGAWQRYAYALKVDGNVRLRFVNNGSSDKKRSNLDDIQMSDYGSSDGLLKIDGLSGSDAMAVYTLDGSYIGNAMPARRGIYIIRQGDRVMKVKH